ncbi:YbaB/EbfC family nucleoid-associated protein [Streptomyces sp. NPDC057271]|uniref:YbaB/EbfC family nucleoid-associated protein n=1 Tax=unclassified Streptomyces TaxID=2593676 RepID=UPI00362F6B93
MIDPANEARLQEILSSFEKKRDAILAAQEGLKNASETVRSESKLVSATVSVQGELTSLTFHNTKYKQMSMNELGKVVLATVREAHERARAQAMGAIAPALAVDTDAPGGISPWDMLPGGLGGANGELMQMIKGGFEQAMAGLAAGVDDVPATPAATGGQRSAAAKKVPGKRRSPARSLDDEN